MVLLLDNYDSFTYNLLDYLGRAGVQCRVCRNDMPLEQVADRPYQAVVLSPGPEEPRKAGNLMQVLAHYAGNLPILGVCLGHQAIGLHFGASLQKAARPMHGKCSPVQLCAPSVLFNGLPESFSVVRYHSLILTELPDCLQPTAYTPQGELMAIQHTELPIAGVQFHPEAIMTEYGAEILKNWVDGWRK